MAKRTKCNNKMLSSQRIQAIRKVSNPNTSLKNNKEVIDFLSLYIDCEVVARKYVDFYNSDRKKGTRDNMLRYDNIIKSQKFFGIKITDELVKSIFSSKPEKRGNKSPRQLRNGIVHANSSGDIKEVKKSSKKLLKLMNEWYDVSTDID